MTAPAHAARRAEGLELLGALAGSGHREGTALARRSDGATVQLTPLLYALLEVVDGDAGPVELAEVLAARTGRAVSASDVETLLDKLGALGLLDGSAAPATVSTPLGVSSW